MKQQIQLAVESNLTALRSTRCVSGLSQEALELLASVSATRTYRNRERVWQVGDPGEFFGIIVKGLIEGVRVSPDGEELMIGLFGPSDVIGLPAVIRKSTYPGSSVVVSKTAQIVKCYFRTLFQAKSDAAIELHHWIREMLLAHEQLLRDKIDLLNAGRVELKILELVHHLVTRFGQSQGNQKYLIPIELTRAQVGRLIKVRTETVIRVVSSWQQKKLIQWTNQNIQIENLALLDREVRSLVQ